MESQKLIGEFKEPCPFRSEEAKRDWEAAGHTLPVKIFIRGGNVWINKAKHYTGVINPRAAGGKWERVTMRAGRLGVFRTAAEVLEHFNAKPAKFRGQPKG